jgi:hypothetical protein
MSITGWTGKTGETKSGVSVSEVNDREQRTEDGGRECVFRFTSLYTGG